MANKFYGKYRSIVADVRDPRNMGRIKVRCPSVLGEYMSAWCTPCVPCAFTDGGLYHIPNVGDSVWIEFEEGDPSKPIWVGSWWKPNRTPNQSNTDVNSKTLLFASKNQHIIEVDDKNNTIIVKMKDGSRVKLGNGIEITAPSGTNITMYGNVVTTGTFKVSGDIYEGGKKLIDKYTAK